MIKKRGIQIRRCQLCGKTGHNRAKCLLFLKNNKVEKTANLKENFELSKSTTKPVIVKPTVPEQQSAHVIVLKDGGKKDVWDKITIFSEIKKQPLKREVVDLGAMVRASRVPAKIELKSSKVHRPKFKLPELNLVAKFVDWQKAVKIQIEQIVNYFKQLKVFIFSRRFAYSLLLIVFVASLPFPAVAYYQSVKNTSAKVVATSTDGFLSLQSSTVAAMQANIPQAEADLNSALKSFGSADSILKSEHQVLQYVVGLLPVVGPEINGRQHLLAAGHAIALGNTYLMKGVGAIDTSTLALTDKIEILGNHLQSAVPQYQEALNELAQVDNKILPVEYQQPSAEFKVLFAALINDLNDLVSLSKSVKIVFGGQELKRYLLVFQNQYELRPSGGFMGSFAILDVQKGKILNLEIPGGGTYDLQGQLSEYIKPPLPLQIVNGRWEFQDANWFPDFPATAKKIEWFYQEARNTTVDGVIAVNASVLERLLKVLGPVSSVENNLTLNTDTALTDLQNKVENDYDKTTNQPKAVLGDLAGQFLEKFSHLDKVNAIRLLLELNEALRQKEIQVYFNDGTTENHFAQFGWTGEILPTTSEQDYLAVIDANLQGQKSDAKIKQVIEHQAVVEDDGSVIDTVVIHRQHLGNPGEMFYGGDNLQYIRVYVPQGSELLAAGGFNYPPESAFHVPETWYKLDSDLASYEVEQQVDQTTGTRIVNEFGKTSFGNWFLVRPGETGSVYFTYRLPFKLDLALDKKTLSLASLEDWFTGNQKPSSKYSLLLQKQSGVNSDFTARVIYPAGWRPIWSLNDQTTLAANGAEYNDTLQVDKLFGVVMEKNK